jgi:hypothetical protein
MEGWKENVKRLGVNISIIRFHQSVLNKFRRNYTMQRDKMSAE